MPNKKNKASKELRYIPQRTEDDCGIACVSMISGLNYEDAWESYEEYLLNQVRNNAIRVSKRVSNSYIGSHGLYKNDLKGMLKICQSGKKAEIIEPAIVMEQKDFESVNDLKDYFKEMVEELGKSVLVGLDFKNENKRHYHWLVYDANAPKRRKIKDPQGEKEMSVDDFFKGYSNEPYEIIGFKLYAIKFS